MSRSLPASVVVFAVACLPSLAFSQMGGTRAVFNDGRDGLGNPAAWQGTGDLPGPPVDRKMIEEVIAIEGRAEVRLRPTEVRLVMAVTSESETAQKCHQAVEATIGRLTTGWTKLGVPPEKIIPDFIAILPRYEWSLETHGKTDVEVEKRAGYRMQTNVHLAVRSEAEARAALAKAFEEGVTDVIAVDYWSRELDESKAKAREQALKAARGKADVLLADIFPKRPPAINVQEQTSVHYPESLYHSFSTRPDEAEVQSFKHDLSFIRAHRPRTTYYRGLYGDTDVQPREMPMSPEISVVSTVRLYFKSPAKEGARKGH